MVKHDFELHQGQDFRIIYEVPSDSDMTLNGFQGVCKIRKRHDEGVIFELEPTIEDKRITFTLLGKVTAKKQIINRNRERTFNVRLRSYSSTSHYFCPSQNRLLGG